MNNPYSENDPRRKVREVTSGWTEKSKEILSLTPEPVKDVAKSTAAEFGKAWSGAREFKDPRNPLNLGWNVGAAGTRGIEYVGQGFDWLIGGASQVTGVDKPVLDVLEIFVPYGAVANKIKHIRTLNKSKKVTKSISTLNSFDKGAEFAFKAEQLSPVGVSDFDEFQALGGIRQFIKPDSPTAKALNSYDPLMKSAQQISEILPHKSLREAGGVGARNLHQAETVQKLIIQKITAAMEEAPNVVKEMFEEIWPNVDPSTLTILEMKKKLAKALGSKTKSQGIATKDLDRGLAEILAGRPEFLDDIGVIEEVIQNPKVLEPKNISKWLGAIDSRLSSTKSGIALHHTHLTSPKDLLHPGNVSDSWRKEFLDLAREKFTPGAEGIVKQDVLGHKPYSSPKIKNKSGKLVTDSSKWNVKGVLADVLDEFTDLPKSATGDIVVNKEVGKIGNYSKGLEGQLQKVIRSINEKAAHAPWSRGTTGWTLDKRLGQFSPNEAFDVAEHIFDLERTVSQQGLIVTRKLNNWKKAVSNGKFGDPPNLEKAIDNLQRSIDNIKIDEKKIRAMEALYQNDLEALLTRGSKGLKIEQTKGSHPFNKQSLMRKQKNGVSQMTSSKGPETLADASIIYKNPSGDKALENVYKKLKEDPTSLDSSGIKGGAGWRETFGVKKV